MNPLEEKVRRALAAVFDPCSVAANAPLSILDMGMVTSLEVGEDGGVSIAIRATTLMCTLIACIGEAVEKAIREVPGVTVVEVRIDGAASDWTEASMTEAGRRILAERRRRSLEISPVRPQAWRDRLPAGSNAAYNNL